MDGSWAAIGISLVVGGVELTVGKCCSGDDPPSAIVTPHNGCEADSGVNEALCMIEV
jgi:hypothetical protein